MLNAIGNYLQQLPLGYSQSSEAAAVEAVPSASTALSAASEKQEYAPSARALLLSAVAQDFNVRALDDEALPKLQQQLLQYGLIGGRDLDAFALLNTARRELGESDKLDALDLIDHAQQDLAQRPSSYSQRQQIGRLHVLLQNLDSAYQVQA
ncbi:MAG: hypothetical protein RL217_51 [Pseudomonadota bacterium]|jgi:hypothetical protein